MLLAAASPSTGKPDGLSSRRFRRLLQGLKDAAVPNGHGARSIAPLRNTSLEAPVLQRVVVDQYRQPAIGRIHRRALWNRPRFERAADLQAKIIVKMGGVVLVHNEYRFCHQRAISAPPRPRRTKRKKGARRLRAPLPYPMALCCLGHGQTQSSGDPFTVSRIGLGKVRHLPLLDPK